MESIKITYGYYDAKYRKAKNGTLQIAYLSRKERVRKNVTVNLPY